MQILDLISVIALVLAVVFVTATIALAGERTLEQVNRDINTYWAQQRYESNQRRQLETLREIEQNTEDCKCE